MSSSQININHEVPSDSITVSVEPPEEIAARLRERNVQFKVKIIKDVVIFVLVTIGIGVALAVAVYFLLFDKTASEETKHWAQTYLISLVTGLVTYTFGHRMGEVVR